ncbi:uncharacterized protein LOC118434443 [Folsomia candida]|uniref:uncharacterized protein LOC118434443 n=1 Tax=Folsomia candida TaxID=158441 RepID=UPI001604FCFE|nr:uncharacterized protein LOC118434443 [Folsomia candida]
MRVRSRGLSHLVWRGTRSDRNSSIRQPEMYGSSVSGTISTPSLNTNNNTSPGGQSRRGGFNDENSRVNSENSRVSALILEAQKAKDNLCSNLADTNNQFQDRLSSYTRPTASWNSVGSRSGGGMTMAELEKERQEGNGSKKLQQEAYRASLERQVEQKSRRMVEEERKLNTHPFGPNYEQPKPSFWQTSKRARPNCPEDIPIQKRILAQNSSTKMTDYKVPCSRVAQARTNLKNSRISPDTYRHASKNASNAVAFAGGDDGGNEYANFTGPSQHHLSSPSGNNFRARFWNKSTGGIMRPPPVNNYGYNMTMGHVPYQEVQQQPGPQFYPPQMQNNQFPLHQPQFMPPGYQQYPAFPGPYPSPYPHPSLGYYPPRPQPPSSAGYQNRPPRGMMMDPHSNRYPFATPRQQTPHPNPNFYNLNNPGSSRAAESRNLEDEHIEQKVAEIQRQMHVEEDDNNNNSNSSALGSYHDGNVKSNRLMPTKLDGDTLRNFVEEKLADQNVDFDELRELVFGRPNNWKTSDTAVDLKPLKDMINRAELAEQIKINQRQKALQAAQDREEEEKLERKIQEYYEIQKKREQNAEAQKDEWARLHNNKKAVSKYFIAEADFQHKPITKPKTTLRESFTTQIRPENPEVSLARKIRHRSRSESRPRESWDKLGVGGDDHEKSSQSKDEQDYSYVKYIEEFQRQRPTSPPIPTHLPKTNEDTLRGKLNNSTFSRPRLSPSILRANESNLTMMRRRIDVEHDLKTKFSNPSF